MVDAASREILWNVHTPFTTALMYALLAAALLIAAVGIMRRAELRLSGKPSREHTGFWLLRILDLYAWGLFQQGVVRSRVPAVAHTLIYVGFLALLFATTAVFMDFDLGIRIYRGRFYLAVTLLSDLLGAGVFIGCVLLARRRYLGNEDQLHSRSADGLMLGALMLLIVQGFVLEGLRIHVTGDPWARYSPVGLLFAKFFWALTPSSAKLMHSGMWWFHTLTAYAVIALAPYTKFFHILSSSANLYFRFNGRPKGALPFPGDLAKLMESGDDFKVGLRTIKDYSWKQLLDLDACTGCGRCQENCPAYLSGKPLSPKWLILDTRSHAAALHAHNKLAPSLLPRPLQKLDGALITHVLLASSGVERRASGGGFACRGAFRGSNPLVQEAARTLGADPQQKIAGEVVDENVFWSCTTCMACVEACPVGVQHVDQIVENRRSLVVMEGSPPAEARKILRALENRGNPFGALEDRIEWCRGLDLKILKPGDAVEYLYWVGCVSAYDPRKQKIARAMVALMRAAGLDFGILGAAENCTGDSARRLGEEHLFQTLAKKNIETLQAVQFKVLVANCPHCFNTLRNEYPQLGDIGAGRPIEVIHHSQLLRVLIEEGKLKLRPGSDLRATFHDPCYLGRYNDEYDAAREVLAGALREPLVEMERNREKGMCCGAGGGHFWMDQKIGRRIHMLRAEQAAETGAQCICSACPFCMQMLEDGLKLTNREEQVAVRDIAEILAQQLAE